MTQPPPIASETPVPRVTGAQRAKPKLVIFDDRTDLLARFSEIFAQWYEVIPIYVCDGTDRNPYDHFIADGKFKRGIPQPVDSYRDERKSNQIVSVHTLDTEIARLKAKKKYKDRHEEEYERLKTLSAFPYAVKSMKDVETILREVKPDFVLSDLEMRRPDPDGPQMTLEEQAADPDIVMGTDIMRMTGEIFPEIPKAIHSGDYTTYPWMPKPSIYDKKTRLIAANKMGQQNGYLVVPKGIDDGPAEEVAKSNARNCQKIHAYFVHQLARGRSEGPTPV